LEAEHKAECLVSEAIYFLEGREMIKELWLLNTAVHHRKGAETYVSGPSEAEQKLSGDSTRIGRELSCV